jgi:serine/threonine protein kinase
LNKEQLFSGGRRTIAWIILGISSLGLNATILKLDPDSNLLKNPHLNNKEQRFLAAITDIKPLKTPNVSLFEDDFIGQGQYGNVYGGLYGKQRVAIKRPKERMQAFQRREFDNSKDLLQAVIEARRANTILPIEQVNMRFIVLSFAKTTDGSLTQKRIVGRNVYETLQKQKAPYTNGYPDDFREAIRRALQLTRTLSLLHKLKVTFGDIRPGNVVIENSPGRNYPCYLVDLGLMQKTGTYFPFCIFGQPVDCLPQEYRAAHPVFHAWQERVEQVSSKLQAIQSKLKSCASAGEDEERLAKKKRQLEARQLKLQRELTDLNDHLPCNYPTAQPSFDIHQFAPVLEAVLLGKSRAKISENPEKFPPHIVAQLHALIDTMLDPAPDKRPSAEEIAQTLQDISCSNWRE